jgi:hypothetical protein
MLTEEEILEGARVGRSLPIVTLPIWDMVDQRRFGAMPFGLRSGNKRGNNGKGKHDVSETHVQGKEWASHGESNPDPSNSPLLR